MDAAIHTTGLTKTYGPARGIEDLDLEVATGEVFGFLGPNGAGKSTTIRLLLDLIRPTRGRAEVLGFDSHRESIEVRRRLGYLPGELALYEHLTGAELVEHFGALRGGIDPDAVGEISTRLGVELDRPIATLSRGNKQKVGLLQAMMHRPQLLVLDEPTNGLDPLAQHVVHEMLDEVRADGRTVFLSSHVLSEVERVADRIGIIRDGRLVAVEHVADLREKAVRTLHATLGTNPRHEDFEHVPGVLDAHVDGRVVELKVHGDMDAIVKTMARYVVHEMTVREPDLEEVFLAYYEDPGEKVVDDAA